MSDITILLVEDEAAIAEPLTYSLKREGWAVDWVATGQDALNQLSQQTYSAIVLDVGLPDRDGFEVCRELRKFCNTPLLFLTARNDEIERIVGLELGADDYCGKPFSPRELISRIKAIWRRMEQPVIVQQTQMAAQAATGATGMPPVEDVIVHGPLRLDRLRFQAGYHGQPLTLTRYEWRLLLTLVERPEQVLTRAQLMQAAWDHPDHSQERTVDSHIKTLRHKLRMVNDQEDPIQTHRGIGYSLIL